MTDVVAALLVGISAGLAVFTVGVSWLEFLYMEHDDE